MFRKVLMMNNDTRVITKLVLILTINYPFEALKREVISNILLEKNTISSIEKFKKVWNKTNLAMAVLDTPMY